MYCELSCELTQLNGHRSVGEGAIRCRSVFNHRYRQDCQKPCRPAGEVSFHTRAVRAQQTFYPVDVGRVAPALARVYDHWAVTGMALYNAGLPWRHLN